MKNTTKRRLLTLLLAFAMVLTLAPTALLSGATTPEQPGGSGGSTTTPEQPGGSGGSTTTPEQPGGSGGSTTTPEQPGGSGGGSTPDTPTTPTDIVTGFTLGGDDIGKLKESGSTDTVKRYELVLDPDATRLQTVRLKVALQPETNENRQKHVIWKSDNSSVASVREEEGTQGEGTGHTANIYGSGTGEANISVSVDDKIWCTIHVEVSGLKLSAELEKGLTLGENEIRTLREGTDYFLYGNAKKGELKAEEVNGKTIVSIPAITTRDRFTISGLREGTGTIRLSAVFEGVTVERNIPLTITEDVVTIPYTAGVSPEKPLKFSDIENQIRQYCLSRTGSALTSVIDLKVPTNQGILYLGYKSPDDPGAGAGSSVTYYAQGQSARGPYISDITFVPNASYKGEKAVITFTGQAGTGSQARTFKGRIEVTLTDEKADVTVKTRRETPLPLTEDMFTRACQEAVGSPLDYVIFTLPSADQGALYIDYKDEWNYATKVSPNQQYERKKLNTITFVPAKGYVGEVRVRYAGYSVSGNKYTGELIIQVQQGLDDAITYNDNGSGTVTLNGSDFNAFCQNATGRDMSYVSFTPPPSSQGVLYNSTYTVQGNEVVQGAPFSQISLSRVTFVAAKGFDGVVRIPFTGQSVTGTAFNGTAEIHIQSKGTGRGDISYICAAGQSVKLKLSDFSSLCETLTGQRLHYITFQNLPDFNQGALYHNRTSSGGMGTRVSTSTKYYNSATPYLANLSFWATQNFSGGVEIPFTGSSVNGNTFTAVLYISNGAGNGSGSSSAITYSVTGQNPARFVGSDFDAACRQATNEALSYIRVSLPTSGQGILYYDYRSETNPTALDTSRNLFLNGEVRVDRVAFVAARGYAGTVSVPYTGWSIKGQQFQGTVQISVRAAGALGGLVRYETTGAPVHISAYDIQEASGGSPSTLRLTGLPEESQGKLYYEYTSPTKYSWQGNTSTQYSLYGDPSVSNLTFVPKAGYYGEVSLPYTASNQDGTTYNGTLRITVTEPTASANFNDLTGYSAQTKSAVDYLYAQGVVNGVGERRYDPGASIRRGDFCLMLARAFQFDVGSNARGFTDVPSDAYYAQAVNQLYALGIVNGVGGGKFNPSASVSRQDAALMVQRTLQQAEISVPDGNAAGLASYADNLNVAGYARGAVSGMVQKGLLPITDNQLAPRSNLTRADMAVLLHRSMTQ